MAHFWWNKANSNTWHDWINEAFAEYIMMVYIKEKYGDEVFQSYVDAYRVNAANSCPIWGIDRATPEAYTALYEKGAIILYDLEQKVGTERFFEFARFMLAENVKTTDAFLTATQNSLGKDTRHLIENKLKAQNYE